ncbi:RNA-dependent ATPase rok1 [Myotisia sp. PD_48]|nr:RNA-dependent ATPase rok1 [Myotisia sp. PD_48]
MDAFKLLTRSIKLRPNTKDSVSDRLPSAGNAATPQLFPTSSRRNPAIQDEIKNRRAKRKRDHDGNENTETGDSTLNFFSNHATSTHNPAPEDRGARNAPAQKSSDIPSNENLALPEAERKAILKSHKIKVTDLRPAKPKPTLSNPKKSSKKSSKKQKREVEEETVLTRKQRKALQTLYPDPLTSFNLLSSKYKISKRLAENIRNQGYTVPSEVQLGSLPLLLGKQSARDGKIEEDGSGSVDNEQEPDLLVVAPTGSGKTLAFLIPAINKILRIRHQNPETRSILAIIVAPTKELAHQIVNEGRKLTVGIGVKVTGMRKGMRIVEDSSRDEDESQHDESDSESEEENPKDLRRARATITKSDILVTTPLQLVHALSDNGKKDLAPLPSVESLVLDEADVLLDPLFREQTLSIWKSCVNPRLQVGLWSATMGSNIEELTKATIKDRQIALNLTEESPLIRLVVGLKDSAVPNITHKLTYAATEQGKLLGLRQLLHPTASAKANEKHLRPPFLVFTQTIPRAVALHSELMYDIPPEAGGSSRIAVLHSELSDTQRSDVMTGFRKGEIWIVITTDLLARGVDFRGINGVVNYDIPNTAAAYVHRVGRTGRAGREGGVAVTFYTKEDIPYVKNIANVIAASEKLRGETGSEKSIQKWLLDALPNLNKNDKKDIKRYGVQTRRRSAIATDTDNKNRRVTRISTKSGYERRLEHNRKGAIEASKKRKVEQEASDDENWGGIRD